MKRRMTLKQLHNGDVPPGVSPGGAATKLRVSRSAVYNAVARGTLDAYYIAVPGGDWDMIYISLESIADYKKNHLRTG